MAENVNWGQIINNPILPRFAPCVPGNPTTAAVNTSYLEDGVIGRTLGVLSRVLSYFQSPQVQDLGMSLNFAKCFVYQPSPRPILHLLPVDIPFARWLGAFVGSSAYRGALEAIVEVTKQAHLLLTEMDDPQVELLLTRACLGSAKMAYLARVTPPDTFAPFATAFE
jgi:hypothetical protein